MMTMLVKMEMVSDGGDGHGDAAADGDDNSDVNMDLEL